MKKIFLILLIICNFLLCENKKEKHPTKHDYLIAWIIYTNQKPIDNCINDYKQLNPLWNTYYTNTFINYSTSCENIIIGDSTMDLSRKTTFYDSNKTHNYSVSGNTACDYLQNVEYIKCDNPKNILIATSDGNGVLRDIPSQVSINTIKKLVTKVKTKWTSVQKVIVIGIHPIQVNSANKNKNSVNLGVSQIEGICYINPLPIWGVGENDLPRDDWMLDSIHYKEPVYSLYKTQILNQCGVGL